MAQAVELIEKLAESEIDYETAKTHQLADMSSRRLTRPFEQVVMDALESGATHITTRLLERAGITETSSTRSAVEQQTTLHRRGHKDDPLYRIRRTLLTGVEHLTERQQARLDKYLPLGDPNGEVELAWRIYQSVRGIYNAPSPTIGRKQAEKLLDVLHTCPVGEVARLGRTLRQWRQQILAYFATGGVNNGGTEAINLLIEKTRRLAHGLRNFDHYRLRILLAADGSRTYKRRPRDRVNHAQS